MNALNIPRQLIDVLAILALGLVYIVALSIGTIAPYGYRKLSTLKNIGFEAIRRLLSGPTPKS